MKSFVLISTLVTTCLCIVEGRGNVAKVGDYPWLALIEYPDKAKTLLRCGGALVSDQYVLTAGHCVVGSLIDAAPPRNVRLGEFDVSNEIDQKDCVTSIEGDNVCTEGAVVIPIERTIPHPEFRPHDFKSRRHDIALLKLTKSVSYSDFIRPISLPTSDMTLSSPSGWELIEAGWGGVYFPNRSSIVKMEMEIPFVSLSECQTAYGNHKIDIWEGQVCAGSKEGNYSCVGDAGGPLMWKNPNGNKDFEVVGIVSFGPKSCNTADVPAVYTKVYGYNSWIREMIKS